MDPLTAIMIGGTVLNIAGQYEANLAQAKRELINARFYKEQASLINLAGERRAYIAKREYANKYSQQVSAAAGSGVDIGGSVANTIAQTLADRVLELEAIKKDTEIQMKMAYLRSDEASTTAGTLSSARYNIMQGAGTLLTSFAQTQGFGTLKKGV